jgi:hypothetical protein
MSRMKLQIPVSKALYVSESNLVEQKRLVFDQQAFCTTQTTRRMRDYGAYLGVSRNDSSGIHHYVKLALLDPYGLHLDWEVQWLRSACRAGRCP